jgi:hypothetical protein
MPMSPRLLRPRQAGGFNPKSISGLNLWIDFSDTSTITLDGNRLIQQINDKSGIGVNLTQSTASNRPSLSTINGKQCGNWGTSTNSIQLSNSTTGRNYREAAIVAVWDANTNVFTPAFAALLSGTATGSAILGFNTASWLSGVQGSDYPTRILNGVTTDVAFPAIKSPSVVQGFANTAQSWQGTSIGMDRNNAGRGWLGRIGEVLCFNRELTAAERQTIMRGLAAKWKVVL